MSVEKKEQPLQEIERKKIGLDVYDNARKFNIGVATKGPAVLYALNNVSVDIASPNVITGVGAVVIGGLGLFGNKYYRNRGEDSPNSFMGMATGGVQMTAGLLLLFLEGYSTYHQSPEISNGLKVVSMSAGALTLGLSAMVLVNSYLYADDQKPAQETRSNRMIDQEPSPASTPSL